MTSGTTASGSRPAVFVKQLHRAAAQRGRLDPVYEDLSDHWTLVLQRLYPVWALIGPGLSDPGHIEIHSRTVYLDSEALFGSQEQIAAGTLEQRAILRCFGVALHETLHAKHTKRWATEHDIELSESDDPHDRPPARMPNRPASHVPRSPRRGRSRSGRRTHRKTGRAEARRTRRTGPRADRRPRGRGRSTGGRRSRGRSGSCRRRAVRSAAGTSTSPGRACRAARARAGRSAGRAGTAGRSACRPAGRSDRTPSRARAARLGRGRGLPRRPTGRSATGQR
jgi:hypothetical protein